MARIMVAEDSDSIRLLLKDLLKLGNHEVVAEAVNGMDAMKKFNDVKPDVLLLDIAMPKKDGLETIKEIMAVNPNAKIVMITASDNLETITQCTEQGALAYLVKPFDSDQVLTSIAMALDEHTEITN
jgi:two-component system chemotaxis response regulator CheY